MIRSPHNSGWDYAGITALVAAAGAALGRLWGTFADRSSHEEKERVAMSEARERVLAEYQQLLQQLGERLGESERLRLELEERVRELTLAQIRQSVQIERLEKQVSAMGEALDEKKAALDGALGEIASLEDEVERLQQQLEREAD